MAASTVYQQTSAASHRYNRHGAVISKWNCDTPVDSLLQRRHGFATRPKSTYSYHILTHISLHISLCLIRELATFDSCSHFLFGVSGVNVCCEQFLFSIVKWTATHHRWLTRELSVKLVWPTFFLLHCITLYSYSIYFAAFSQTEEKKRKDP